MRNCILECLLFDKGAFFLNVRVHREAMSRMKEGEEEKTKSYTALVWTQKPLQEEDLTFIDDIKVPPTNTHTATCLSLSFYPLKLALWLIGPDPGPKDAPEGPAPAGAGRAPEGCAQHERTPAGPPSLLPEPEDAGRHVSSPSAAVYTLTKQ